MRVLVTGNRGYIGSVMVPMLVSSGFKVIGLDTDFYRNCSFQGVGTDKELAVSTLNMDVRTVGLEDLHGFDAVVHLAALSNDALGELDSKITFEINADASIRVARAAKAAGVKRFVFLSSCSTYGAAGDDFLTEEADFNPVTAYGLSKVRAELEIAKLADDQFSPTFLRSATAYGVSPRLRLDVVLNNLVAWAIATGKVRLSSDGLAFRPLVHIEDISRAVIAALSVDRTRVHNEAFNVGRTEENYRIREVAEIVRDAVPGSQIEIADSAATDARWYRVDCSKIKKLLPEFKPQWSLAAGAEQLYKAYQTSGLTMKDIEGTRFMRIAQLRQLLGEGRLQNNLHWREAA